MNESIKTHRSGVVVAQEDDTIEQILDRMAKQNLGSIVVEKNGKPTGIFTERDLLRKWRMILAPSMLHSRISSVMSSPVLTLKLTEVSQATEIMFERRVRHVPVVDGEGHLIGIVSARDIIARAAKTARAQKGPPAVAPPKEAAPNSLYLISPEATLVTTCQSLLAPNWKAVVHQGPAQVLSPAYWQEQSKSTGKAAFFVDIDGLKNTEWKALLRQLLALLTKVDQPDVFLVWSPGQVSEKDLESLRTITKSANWRAYERPISLGQLIEDLKNLGQ